MSAPDDPWRMEWDLEAEQQATEGMAPLAFYWDWIRSKEIERPGVAGAFWHEAPKWTVDADEWLLTLLEQAGPEPYIHYFPVNLGFEAHERYSRDPDAIRRLMNVGHYGIALAAAGEEKHTPVEGMIPLLMELGDREEPEEIRLASWDLAYLYNCLHPKGEQFGFVQRHTEFKGFDLYLLFSKRSEPDIPYAVVLYPKSPQQYWTARKANALVDQIFPEAVRGALRTDSYSPAGWTREGYHAWYESGYIDLATSGNRKGARGVRRITIGYRSYNYWNPLTPLSP